MQIVFGAIAGEGIGATLIMNMLRPVLRNARLYAPQPTPLALIERGQMDLADDRARFGSSAGLALAHIDMPTHTLYCVNAGIPIVIVMLPGQPPRQLFSESPLLGEARTAVGWRTAPSGNTRLLYHEM